MLAARSMSAAVKMRYLDHRLDTGVLLIKCIDLVKLCVNYRPSEVLRGAPGPQCNNERAAFRCWSNAGPGGRVARSRLNCSLAAVSSPTIFKAMLRLSSA